jgi:SSS family solute:Na+ symporter
MQAWWMFCICCVIYIIVSLFSPAPAEEKIRGLTWEHPLSVVIGKPLTTVYDPRIFAALLLFTMATLYYIFR